MSTPDSERKELWRNREWIAYYEDAGVRFSPVKPHVRTEITPAMIQHASVAWAVERHERRCATGWIALRRYTEEW